MNSRIISLISSIIVLSAVIPTVSAFDTTGCDQVFQPAQLRHGYSYHFWDEYTNNNTYKHQVYNLPSVVYAEQYDYNGSTTFPSFGWSPGLIAQAYQINPSQSIRAVDADSNYPIIYRPATRSPDNLVLRYTIQYYAQNAGTNWTGPYTHVECQPYEITWCGDGVKDSGEGETCDDGAQNGQPGKCNVTCNGTVPNPPINGVCNPAYNGQTLPGPYNWTDVAGVVCSAGTPIQGTGFPNGPWTWSCNGQNGGTNASCSAAKTPPPINGVCSSTVTGPQSSPLSNGSCNVGPVIGFTSAGTNPVNYSWTCGGQNGGSPSGTCSASYNAPPPPVPGVCSSTVTGPQSSPLSNGSCNVGTVAGFTSAGTNPVNYSWTCTGLNGGASSSTCSASYTPPPPPIPGVCSSTVTGPQPAPISNGACNVGPVIGFTSAGTNPVNYSWTCGGQNGGSPSGTCSASYTPAPINGVCGPTHGTNVASKPSTGLCNVGAPSLVAGTGPWTWSCTGSNGGNTANCSANPIPVNGVCGPANGVLTTVIPTVGLCNVGIPSIVSGTGPWSWTCAGSNGGTNATCGAPNCLPTDFQLSIKKYVDGVDAQDNEAPVSKNEGDTANYTFIVKNEGIAVSTGITTVTDDLPFYINRTGAPTGSGWNCSASTATRVICTSTASVSSGSTFPTITVPIRIGTGATGIIRNLVVVSTSVGNTVPGRDRDPASIIISKAGKCSSTLSGALAGTISAGACDIGTPINFLATGTNPIVYSWSCSGVGSGATSPMCQASYTAPCPGVCTGSGNPNLVIKKAAQGQDGQTLADAAQVTPGSAYSYTYTVSNTGSGTATGVTVTDTFPRYVSVTAVPTGTDWNCAKGTKTIMGIVYHTVICTYTKALLPGATAPVVTVPALLDPATPDGSALRNIAYVCRSGASSLECDHTCTNPNDPSCTPPPPPPNCDPMPGSPNYDPACVVPSTPPKCSTTLSGALSSPITAATAGLCNPGTLTGFTIGISNVVPGIVTENYLWSCTKSGHTSVNCNASYSTGTTGTGSGSPILSIKKAAQGQDGQTLADAAQVTPGSAFSYTYTVANTGSGSATGVTITDTFPRYVSVTAVPTGTDWNCAKGTKTASGITYHTVICTYTKPLLANTTAPVVTVPAMLDPATPSGSALRNIAYVCRNGVTTPECNPGCLDPNNPSCNPPPPPPNCDPMPGSPNYDPACVVTPGGSPILSIKKAAQGQDGQTLADAAQVTPGSAFSYTYTVANTGSGSATGVTITDTFPRYVSVTAVPTGTDWNCAKGTKTASGITYHTVICTYTKPLLANTTAPVVTVPAMLDPATPSGSALRNIAYVCRNGVTTPECNPGCLDPNNPSCNPPPPPPNCDPMPGSPNYDPACVVSGSGFTISIKKYVDFNDAQTTSSGYIVSYGQLINYSLVVKNEGPLSTTGVTTVTDSLPTGVALSGAITGTGWSCAGTVNISCSSSAVIAAGATYPSINIPVRVTALSGSVINEAVVANPNATTNPGTDRDPAVILIGNGQISIKKAAQGQDGQTLADAAQVTPGSAFSYTYTVANTGSGSATGVTITDTFPRYVSVTAVPTGTDWNCAKGTKTASGITYHTVICTYTKPLLANTTAPVVTVPAMLDPATPSGSALRNIAYVCRNGVTTPECNPGCLDPNNPSCNPPPPPPNCDPMPGSPNYDPACVVTNSEKRCDVLSSNPSASTLAPASSVTYTCSAAGTGIVLSDLEYRITCGSADTGAAYGSGNTKICTLPNSYGISQTVTCSVRERTSGTVYSGSEVGACKVTKSTSNGGGCSGNCGGSSMYYVPKCVNGIPSCTQYVANNLAECNAANGNNCMSHAQCDPAGLASLSCSGGGGSGYCGDGVLQPYAGEECDVGFSNTISSDRRWCGQPGEVDASGNNVGCKIRITTNPGANPITGLWMTIPRLSNARLGNSQLDIVPGNPNLGRVNFASYQLVLGINTQAFTLADTVGFGIKTGEPIALAIPKNKYFCLGSGGSALNSNTICTTFGALANASYQTYPNVAEPGNPYILIGDGYYQYPSTQNSDGTWNYLGGNASSPNNIDLFRGPSTYGSNTLANAFRGSKLGIDDITLFHYSSVGGMPIDLVTLPVKVASPMVGTSSTTLTRSSLATFMNSRSVLSTFLSHFSDSTTTSTVTSSTTTSPTGAANVISLGAANAPVGGLIVSGTTELSGYKLNGNNNVYAVKGNITLNCTSGITATPLAGVKTLVVENGDLTINCNNTYPSSDTSSSWAFIVKGGNIKISNTVTNLVGVYVTIPEGGNGGKYLSLEGSQTNNIITINGSLYGDAADLFNKRNYLRGTNAYDTLTTGVILSYSNRALVSPPPLLSQYLNNYTVTRVVR